MSIPAGLRRAVVSRAGNRCEYCRLSQVAQEATFHIDHVRPLAAGGETDAENLALACVSCSLRKGARLSVLDREGGVETGIFNPRKQLWSDHFKWLGDCIMGKSAAGTGTVELLKMNRGLAVAIRAEERFHGRHPAG